jgi:hypothetical protein
MLYRILREDENIENGLMATDPLSDTTVVEHVCHMGKFILIKQDIYCYEFHQSFRYSKIINIKKVGQS